MSDASITSRKDIELVKTFVKALTDDLEHSSFKNNAEIACYVVEFLFGFCSKAEEETVVMTEEMAQFNVGAEQGMEALTQGLVFAFEKSKFYNKKMIIDYLIKEGNKIHFGYESVEEK